MDVATSVEVSTVERCDDGRAQSTRYARYIGRVGGLAVLLGVGAAIATGVAAADTGSAASDTPSASASASASEAEGTSEPDGGSQAAPDTDEEDGADEPAAEDDVDSAAMNEAEAAEPADNETDEAPTDEGSDAGGDVESPSGNVDADLVAEDTSSFEQNAPGQSSLQPAGIETRDNAAESSSSETVITGLFREVLREDPTESELLRYSTVLEQFGTRAVVSRLYNSTAFREDQVDTYYLELLGRDPSDAELKLGTFLLKVGVPETRVIARIAGTREFYAESGGTATSFVNLLYRSVLCQTADKDELPVYVQQLQAGRSLRWVASQFVRSDDFRAVKVDETFQIVLGRDATDEELVTYAKSWFFRGGQAGIAKSLLAGDENMIRMQSSEIPLPDPIAVAQPRCLT